VHPEQLVKTIHAVWRPGAIGFDKELALRCFEFDAEDLRDYNLWLRFAAGDGN